MKEYSDKEKQILRQLAIQSIDYGLKHHSEMPIDIKDYPENLREVRASFVTLNINGQLRGCIGSLEAYRPLVEDIASNAYAAAFLDPRFYPLSAEELTNINIHIAILSEPEPMQFTSEEDLIKQLRPGVDGLILSDNGYKGTFLPAVWESLPEPTQFLSQLKLKAGLPEDYWADTITVYRYTTVTI